MPHPPFKLNALQRRALKWMRETGGEHSPAALARALGIAPDYARATLKTLERERYVRRVARWTVEQPPRGRKQPKALPNVRLDREEL